MTSEQKIIRNKYDLLTYVSGKVNGMYDGSFYFERYSL